MLGMTRRVLRARAAGWCSEDALSFLNSFLRKTFATKCNRRLSDRFFARGRRLANFKTNRDYVWIMRGVMKKINSWFDVVTVRCLKRLPRYGTSPSNGT